MSGDDHFIRPDNDLMASDVMDERDVCYWEGYRRGLGEAEVLRERISILFDAVKSIAENTCCEGCQEARLVAKNALDASRRILWEDPISSQHQPL